MSDAHKLSWTGRPRGEGTVSKHQQGQVAGAKHPVQPRGKKLDIGEAHRAITKTYPKILAELAK